MSYEIENFDTYDVDGANQDFILINFKQDKMKLRIPKEKPSSSGLRKLTNKIGCQMLDVLVEKPAVKKTCGLKELKNMRKILTAAIQC